MFELSADTRCTRISRPEALNEIRILNPLSAKITKWSNTLKQFVGNLPTNCLSVFDHFVGLALKGLNISQNSQENTYARASFNRAAGLSLIILKNMLKTWKFTKNKLCQRCFDNNLLKIKQHWTDTLQLVLMVGL